MADNTSKEINEKALTERGRAVLESDSPIEPSSESKTLNRTNPYAYVANLAEAAKNPANVDAPGRLATAQQRAKGICSPALQEFNQLTGEKAEAYKQLTAGVESNAAPGKIDELAGALNEKSQSLEKAGKRAVSCLNLRTKGYVEMVGPDDLSKRTNLEDPLHGLGSKRFTPSNDQCCTRYDHRR